MIQELYINGVLADIDESLALTLQYKSFLFVGISDIQANRSWNVSLKKTKTNLGIIEQSHTSDSDSIFPYRNYVVDYYLDGFRIIDTGKAILLRVSDKLEFVFMFGTAFDKIKTLSDKKLNELTESVGDGNPINEGGTGDWMNWNRNVLKNQNPMTRGAAYVDLYTFTNKDNSFPIGTDNADLPSTLHPSVSFDYILGKIEKEYTDDISHPFDLSELRSLVYAKQWGTILKGIEYSNNAVAIPSSTYPAAPRKNIIDGSYSNVYRGILVNSIIPNDIIEVDSSQYETYDGDNTRRFASLFYTKEIAKATDYKIKCTLNTKIRIRMYVPADVDVNMATKANTGISISKIDNRVVDGNVGYDILSYDKIPYTEEIISRYATVIGWGYLIELTYTDSIFEFDFQSDTNNSFYFNIQSGASGFGVTNTADGFSTWRFDTNAYPLTIEATPKTSFYGGVNFGVYTLIPNLPQLSCADFIYQCMQMLGVFPYLKEGEPNKIYFRSAKVLYDNLQSSIRQLTTNTQTISLDYTGNYNEDIQALDNETMTVRAESIEEITATIFGTCSIPYFLNFAVNLSAGTYIFARRFQIYAGHGIVDFDVLTPILDIDLSATNKIYFFADTDFEDEGDYTLRCYQEIVATDATGSIDLETSIGFFDNDSFTITNVTDSYVANPKVFQDWTTKLIKTTETEGELEHVEFTFGKYAKQNILDYKVNETNPIDSSDYIEVDNENLEAKQDLARLQLSAPQVEKLDSRMIAYWLYDVKLDGGVFKTEYTGGSNNDIVCKLVKNATNANYDAIFPIDMQFNGSTGLKTQYYTEYQKLVRKPRFIKEKFRMMPYDLQGYDPEIPIYLAQYGKYYAVMTMQVGSDLIAECELLELKEI